MSPKNLDEQLAEILALAQAATEGPLVADTNKWPGNDNLQWWVLDCNYSNDPPGDGCACFLKPEDAQLFAASRTLVPQLVAVIQLLRSQRDDYISMAYDDDRSNIQASKLADNALIAAKLDGRSE